MIRTLTLAFCLSTISIIAASADGHQEDPFLWLEDIQGDESLAWVEEQNVRSTKRLESLPAYSPIFERTLQILDSEDRIPMPDVVGAWVYNFWQDKNHVRGILRRTPFEDYGMDESTWEIVLDVDALATDEDVPWVYKGKTCLAPEYRRCMISLSNGGGDTTEKREFNTVEKSFTEGGFILPKSKSFVAWENENTLWVATDFGQGSLTNSGYPRFAKAWNRGTPLEIVPTRFAVDPEKIAAWPISVNTSDKRYVLIHDYRTFFDSDLMLVLGDRLVRLDLPKGADFKSIFRDRVLFALRSDWQVDGTKFASGTLLSIKIDDLLQGKRRPKVLFEPSERVALHSVATTRDRVLISTLDNVRSRLFSLSLADGHWQHREITLPGVGTVSIVTTSENTDTFFFKYTGFIAPDTLFKVDGEEEPIAVSSLPSYFAAEDLSVSQHEAISRDGTRIPYFLVAAKGLQFEGTTPTLLTAYGGFGASRTSTYDSVVGASWLERGGAFVLANIRGGGEFGPSWHDAAVQENHYRNFEDFIAVSEDLITRKITSPEHLGIVGGSQGGLLVGGTFVLRPDLFGAVVCRIPLLDMKRYHKLLAGASWMSEYGNPDDPDDWAFIKEWSPYQLLVKNAEYPEIFIWTSTRDDRVHPGHARKMAAKMLSQGHQVLYFEQTEGGHSLGANNAQKAKVSALEYAYLWDKLKKVPVAH